MYAHASAHAHARAHAHAYMQCAEYIHMPATLGRRSLLIVHLLSSRVGKRHLQLWDAAIQRHPSSGEGETIRTVTCPCVYAV